MKTLSYIKHTNHATSLYISTLDNLTFTNVNQLLTQYIQPYNHTYIHIYIYTYIPLCKRYHITQYISLNTYIHTTQTLSTPNAPN